MRLTDAQITEMRAGRGAWFLADRERAMLDALLGELAVLRALSVAASAFLAAVDVDADLDDPTSPLSAPADALEDALLRVRALLD